MVIHLIGMQNHGRKIGMIDRIREKLCFHAKGVTRTINNPIFPFQFLVEKVSSVEMHTGQCSFNGHRDTGIRRAYLRCISECTNFPINYIIVVISIRLNQLHKRLVDARSNGHRHTKIHRCSGNRRDFTRRDTHHIGGRVILRTDAKLMLGHKTRIVAI